jgi:FkbM family methyltransferase
MAAVIKAGFISSAPNWFWLRQFPTAEAIWDGVKFQFVGDLSDCDCLFVFDDLPAPVTSNCGRQRLVFVASEPPNVKRYDTSFLSQFAIVLTTDRQTPHPRRLFSQVGLPWHVGAWSEDGTLRTDPMRWHDFEAFRPTKTKLVSVVSSNKDFTPEHRARLRFVSELKSYFGEEIGVFGRGINDFADKLQVLASYRYHIALENCATEDYWTEKLSDPFLTLTYPIYYGCPNAADYFPSASFTPIDISDPQAAVATIERIIHSDVAERAQPALQEARSRVLREHNLFALLARTARQAIEESSLCTRAAITLLPQSHFQPLERRLRWRAAALLRRSPTLYFVARGARNRLKSGTRSLRDTLRKAHDIQFRSHQAWLKNQPDERLRYSYDLTPACRVLDIGGFKGDFTARLIAEHGVSVTVFEPIPSFAEAIRHRYASDPRVTLIEAALSHKDGEALFNGNGDSSGAFAVGEAVKVRLLDATRFLEEHFTHDIALAKLNIEGEEYALLEHLVATGHIRRFKNLQVQFHLNVPQARSRYWRLARSLRRTHRLTWRYPFVWENWARKTI